MKRSILIIDDEALFREDLAILLRRAGYDVFTACDAGSGVEESRRLRPDIVLCDLSLPDRSGLEIIGELRTVGPDTAVIMITAFGDMDSALSAFRFGAVDYLLKPVSRDELMRKINGIDQHMKLQEEVSRLRQIINQREKMDPLIGESRSMKSVKEYIRRVAPVDSSVLITGESGTGKEIVAREVHRQSQRSDAPFLALNCGAIPDQLLESELFGHTRGAFTGATDSRKGFFELAGEGTLLLDEIGDMPSSLQAKLLRALEQKEFFPVGSSVALPLCARILSSTNRNLAQLIEQNIFREDLLYRINIIEITVVPLRERLEDIPLLVDFLLQRMSSELRRSAYRVDREVLDAFMRYQWPGNVRQLKNVIERALILGQSDTLKLCDFPPEICGESGASGVGGLFNTNDLREATLGFQKTFIENIIRKCDGNREDAAKCMGINPSTLYRKLSELG